MAIFVDRTQTRKKQTYVDFWECIKVRYGFRCRFIVTRQGLTLGGCRVHSTSNESKQTLTGAEFVREGIQLGIDSQQGNSEGNRIVRCEK